LLDDRVRDELAALPPDMQARFRRIVELIQGYGIEQFHEPHVKHLGGLLW
jgi:phage-related protein